MPPFALCMLLFLPIHECTALHPLDIIGRKVLLAKDGEKMKLLGIASPLKEKPSMEAEERVMNIPNWDGFRATLRMEGTWWKILGNKIISSALEEKQLETSNKQGLKRIARSTLESTSHGTDEPMHSSSRDEHVEDAVVMDYAQPHRKPPIHDHKP